MEDATPKHSMQQEDSTGSFGEKIRDRRRELGLTQHELVERVTKHGIEISQPFLSQVENGKFSDIGSKRLSAIASSLNLSMEDLVNSRTGNPPLP